MTVAAAGALLVCAAGGWRLAVRMRRMLHLLQLEHYENGRLRHWLRRRGEFYEPALAVAVALAVVAVVLAVARAPAVAALAAGVLAAAVVFVLQRRAPRRADVKPLQWTERARRLYAAALAVPALLVVAGVLGTVIAGSDLPLTVAAVGVLACLAGAAWLLCAANRALAPVQRRINARFERRALQTLATVDPLVVGITGSYGKTTTKVCVGGVLSQAMETLITPASFNSRLGVIRTVNELLEPAHRAFVVEMGMYRKGDIAELCALVHPSVGVLTAIGPMHLERLGSIEAIADAKAELALALPGDGRLVVNGDDPRCVEIAGRVSVDTVLYGLDNPDASVRAEGVEMADGQTRFELVVDGSRAPVSAGLLGRHNVSNLLAAAAVGHVLGMSVAQIARGLDRVTPPEHRLQPIPNPRAGIVVIDDAYNSNPAGAQAALEVLHGHAARRRILVTPGMVELGDEEAELNERFGRQAAAVCDHVILVGPARTRPIAAGLHAEGFAEDAISVVTDISGATEVLASLTRPGDVILFENDLPDLYAEPAAPIAVAS